MSSVLVGYPVEMEALWLEETPVEIGGTGCPLLLDETPVEIGGTG
jgi:hypothetical protein